MFVDPLYVTLDCAICVAYMYKDRLTAQGLLSYLSSEENNVLAPNGIDQHMEMGRPLNCYFINSSHNTYLNGTIHYMHRMHTCTCMYMQCIIYMYSY